MPENSPKRKLTIHYEIDLDNVTQEDLDAIRSQIVQELARACDSSKGHIKVDHDQHIKGSTGIEW